MRYDIESTPGDQPFRAEVIYLFQSGDGLERWVPTTGGGEWRRILSRTQDSFSSNSFLLAGNPRGTTSTIGSSSASVPSGSYNTVQARVEFTLTGHPPILRVRGGEVTEVAESHIPLGVMPDWTFGSATLDLEPGDLLAVVTDGLFEVFDAKDRDFGLDGIKQALASSANRPLADIATHLLDRVRAFGAQLDDQTLLLIRFR